MARTTFWWRISAASSLGGQQQRIETPSSRKGQSSKASVVEQVQGVQLADKPGRKRLLSAMGPMVHAYLRRRSRPRRGQRA
ncbi:uncharacterized protein LOC112084638 isoform X3 [Eutrema salsugineum]|uniref:uncharacterized protein LOC112084638 isoform X3 n=1 Tax=Eutrema salsugineum TaxID=72664 RepID=UPI000CED487E|nr:uncharacterized protein LOC112084638 isoform X3 [Eutrema salsugineum]